MSNILRKLTVRSDHPVDALLIRTLYDVDACTHKLGMAYFIGGAQARDLILTHVYGQDTEIRTGDIDFGICVDEVIMKLFAWLDRHQDSSKDAGDVWLILKNYAEAGNLDRLYEESSELLSESGWDIELAGAKLLAQDAIKICKRETISQLINAFKNESLYRELVNHIIKSVSHFDDGRAERIEKYVEAFLAHFRHTV